MIDEKEVLTSFVSDFARTTYFEFKNSTHEAYKCGVKESLEMMNFY